MRIMIVEDQWPVAMDMQRTLADAGHDVLLPATSASEAMLLASERHPDLAIVDIGLPEGPVGIGLASYLKKRWNIPTIIVTAHVQNALAADGVFAIIAKPYTNEMFLRTVSAVETQLEQ